MKKIDISTPSHPNKFTLVDDKDYVVLNKYKWTASRQRPTGTFYALRGIYRDNKWTTLSMHLMILGNVEGKEIDHRDRDGLNNQRHNLRHCTNTENQRNRVAPINNSSGYKGIGWSKRDNRWRARLAYNGKDIYIGQFKCLIKAVEAYDKAVVKYHGEFAQLNFPERMVL